MNMELCNNLFFKKWPNPDSQQVLRGRRSCKFHGRGVFLLRGSLPPPCLRRSPPSPLPAPPFSPPPPAPCPPGLPPPLPLPPSRRALAGGWESGAATGPQGSAALRQRVHFRPGGRRLRPARPASPRARRAVSARGERRLRAADRYVHCAGPGTRAARSALSRARLPEVERVRRARRSRADRSPCSKPDFVPKRHSTLSPRKSSPGQPALVCCPAWFSHKVEKRS